MITTIQEVIKKVENRRAELVEAVTELGVRSSELWAGTRERISRDATGQEPYSKKDRERDQQKLADVRSELDRSQEEVEILDAKLMELKTDRFEQLRDRQRENLQRLCQEVGDDYAAWEAAIIQSQPYLESIRSKEAELAVASSQYRKFDDQLPLSRQKPAGANWPLNGQAFDRFAREFAPITKGEFLE